VLPPKKGAAATSRKALDAAQQRPVLGRVVIEGEQGVEVVADIGGGLGPLDP